MQIREKSGGHVLVQERCRQIAVAKIQELTNGSDSLVIGHNQAQILPPDHSGTNDGGGRTERQH